MDKKLEKLMDMLLATLEKGGDLLGEHAPKIVEEILTYEFAVALTWSLFFGALFILCLISFFYTWIKGIRKDDKLALANASILGIGLVIIGAVFCNNLSTLTKIKMAPRVYTIKYLKDFSNGRK